jgi:hypothetical protein
MNTLFRAALTVLVLATGAPGHAQATPAAGEEVQVEVRLATEPQRTEAPAHAEPVVAEMSDHLDPAVIAGIAGAISVYSVVSGMRRRRAQQARYPKPV